MAGYQPGNDQLQTRVPLVDTNVSDLDQDNDFADVNHLNASGAARTTAALAEMLGSCATDSSAGP
jgi:hypothetical protein